METFDIPLELDSRWEWIKFQLRVRGKTIADLAREIGLNERALRSAKQRAYPRVEREIAKALGLQPVQLWPERWHTDGTPHRLRPNRAEANSVNRAIEDSGYCPVGNTKTGGEC
ncbi:helix-turn-helix domain-containing protein [Pseudomonas oryzihabitans]|uniref:helix-turn-helix domain-containing protein n=1 Tax=Pseudomonas oryzihabitans TaxID=47885 RepID=UPI00289B2064|nr:helix-turn-helix domain-containing protein [Pseudomonas oryzihabitans]